MSNDEIFNKRLLQMALRTDLVSFIAKVVGTINAAYPYLDNYHVWTIAWHLEQVRLGKIKRLIICLPPRSLKSIIASVAFPAFVLGHNPNSKIISVTYSNQLAAKYANDFRLLVSAPWYKRLFPHTQVSPFKDTETETVFSAGGFRLASSTTGTLTGRGGNLIICDDLMKAQDVASDVRREAINELYRNTILSRLDDKQTGAIVVVMQRLHANDFVGSLLDSSDEWTVLKLPAIAETDERIQIGDNEFYHRKAGEPLHTAREPLWVLEQRRLESGPDIWAAQYQQDPVPPGGNIIKKECFRYHSIDVPQTSYKHRIIQSWDTAGKTGPRNSFSVCTTWLVSDGNYYLLDMVRGRFDFATLKATAEELARRFKPSVILIEDASSGSYLAGELRKSGLYQVKLVPPVLDKVTRLWNQAGKFAAGRVFFPQNAWFLPIVERELLTFPKAQTNDIVDSISQALAYQGSTYTLANIR